MAVCISSTSVMIFRLCPFTVVVFPGALRQVGDVRRLEGRQIEGEVKGYDGRAEIILKRPGQLHGRPPIASSAQRTRRRTARQIQCWNLKASEEREEIGRA